MLNPQKNQKGFAAFYITLLIMAVILGIAGSIFISTWGEQKISGNIVKSSQAYYIAEAGIEDALFRLSKNPEWVRNTGITYQLKVDEATTTVKVSGIIGGSRTITSEGNMKERFRKIEVAYEVSTEKVSFRYGAQVDEGGIIMDDNSQIEGNVFSNGNINAGPNTQITGTVRVAKNGNYINGVNIGKDAYVYQCLNSEITGTLNAATTSNCTYGNYVLLSEEIATSALPISQEQINQWKEEAASGGTISDYTLSGTQKASLGPKKIEGTLILQNNAELSITGTIWVTGNITIQDKAKAYLDKNAYGSNSGVIISDGKTTLQNSSKTFGSGETGSYIMLISTATGDAITIQDSAETDILFTQNGYILIQNSAKLREISGYGIHLKNSVKIIYEVGLQDTSFTSGPGGTWEVTSWKEVE